MMGSFVKYVTESFDENKYTMGSFVVNKDMMGSFVVNKYMMGSFVENKLMKLTERKHADECETRLQVIS